MTASEKRIYSADTGDGKGKTSAAFGSHSRRHDGEKVYIAQFVKA